MKTTHATAKSTKAAERAEAVKDLKKLLKPGRTVYTILRSRSASGMTRHISLAIAQGKTIRDISWLAARAMDRSFDRDTFGIKTSGCGMDMGFELVYNLGRTLYPKGFVPAKAGKRYGRNGTDANAVDRDGGYALEHSWL